MQQQLKQSKPLIINDISNTATGFFQIPAGTTAQRPATPLDGMRRYNTTTLRDEFYANGAWQNHVRLGGDTFTGTVTAPSIVSDFITTKRLKTIVQRITVTGTTQTIDLTLGNRILLNLSGATGTVVLTLNGATEGESWTLDIIQSTTARFVVYPNNTKQRGGLGVNVYNNPNVPVANLVDKVGFDFDGTNFNINPSFNYQ